MPKDDEVHGSTGTSYDFGARLYDPRVGRWLSMDPAGHETPSWTPYRFAFSNPVYWLDRDGKREFPTYVAYQSYANANGFAALPHEKMGGQGHWLRSDRGGQVASSRGMSAVSTMTDVFRQAASVNTFHGRPGEYQTVPERQAYYGWADEFFTQSGYQVKWMNAAEKTVGNLNMAQGAFARLMGAISPIGSNAEINNFIETGNKAILDDMMPRVLGLAFEGPLTGEQARAWDAQTLSDEQNLIQPFYEALSQESRDMLTSNLKFKYGDQWSGDLMNPNDRWQFGMRLMGYEDARGDCMPEPTNKQD